MNRLQCEESFEKVLTERELKAVTVNQYGSVLWLVVDLHEFGTIDAKRLINNLIALVRGSFEFVIIHGYHHGTAIKEMVQATNWGSRVIYKVVPDYNPGETIMRVAA